MKKNFAIGFRFKLMAAEGVAVGIIVIEGVKVVDGEVDGIGVAVVAVLVILTTNVCG